MKPFSLHGGLLFLSGKNTFLEYQPTILEYSIVATNSRHNCKMSTETPAALVGDNGGDPQGTLPALQDWAAARTLALTQPTQPKDGASVQTTLRDSPETPLGFSLMAITLPTAVTPMGASPASTTFLLPYTEGQVEALLTAPLAAAAKAKRKGFRLTTGTSRDHEQVSQLPLWRADERELSSNTGLSSSDLGGTWWYRPYRVVPRTRSHRPAVTSPGEGLLLGSLRCRNNKPHRFSTPRLYLLRPVWRLVSHTDQAVHCRDRDHC